ncbi:hypothetical protein CEXT_389681 [Caerostris extrusa]|uniref:SWIM-type domain-containing protein n=1 Tax=Caerostris extrusa TaxID=172846 RepID=A0AAV4U697_CAEEX|nr:hypothetical protein CEXT_389681 [Caerostris extrusa]
MEVIDEILTSAKKSDFQNGYLQLNANLSKKEYLLNGHNWSTFLHVEEYSCSCSRLDGTVHHPTLEAVAIFTSICVHL